MTISSEPAVAARRLTRRGFTVVELLVVIAVIGILMSLITVAAYNALWAARQTRIKLEVDNLSMALKAFKEKYGSYPPINMYEPMTNSDLKSFVAKAFPRYKLNEGKKDKNGNNRDALTADLDALGVDVVFDPGDPENGDAATALVFWLSGFRPDVTNPFCSPKDVRIDGGPRARLFDFEPTRVHISGTSQVASMTNTDPTVYKPGKWVYLPLAIDAPYLYFDSRSYLSHIGSNPPAYSFQYADKGFATPYWNDTDLNDDKGETFVNPDSFQLISAGQDGAYGGTTAGLWHLYPTGMNMDNATPANKFPYAPEEKDNVTNFCEKNNLEDAKPN